GGGGGAGGGGGGGRRPAAGAAGGGVAVSGRSPAGLSAERSLPVQIRRLVYPDLPDVIAIERRVFPTPWSMAMFVLELSKQTGICLAAVSEGRLVAYLICSRYESVWHLMNVAVVADCESMGLASRLLAEPYERVGDESARFTLEVPTSYTG